MPYICTLSFNITKHSCHVFASYNLQQQTVSKKQLCYELSKTTRTAYGNTRHSIFIIAIQWL